MALPKKRPKIIKVIWSIPHYRVPIFRRLSQNPNMDFIVCAGNNPQTWGGGTIASAADIGMVDGINWHEVRSVRIQIPLFRWYEWQPEAIKLIVRQKPDVVICLGNQSFSNLIIRIYCRVKGIPLIEWTQGVIRPEKGLKWFFRKVFFRLPNAIMFYGNFARQFFSEHGFDDKKLFVVYNSLDYDKQKEIRQRMTAQVVQQWRSKFGLTNPDDRLIFNSSRLEKGKEIDLLIRAVANLKQQGHRVLAVLIGDGSERQALQELAYCLEVSDCVRFYGACYDEDLLGLIFSASDLCVMPGPVGLIAMHSMVYGTPLLTCENTQGRHGPEIETLINGKTGRFFRQGDVDDLTEKIKQMLYPVPCKVQMKQACMDVIDKYYNPEYQEKVVIEALNSVLPRDKKIDV